MSNSKPKARGNGGKFVAKEAPAEVSLVTCPDCGGTGLPAGISLSDATFPCPKCEGNGTIEAETKTEEEN